MTEKSKKNRVSRRDFIRNGSLAAAGFYIVPRHVLGGKGFVAPSDKLVIAGVGPEARGDMISVNLPKARMPRLASFAMWTIAGA